MNLSAKCVKCIHTVQYDYRFNLKPDIPFVLFTIQYMYEYSIWATADFHKFKALYTVSDRVDEVPNAFMLRFFEFQVSTMFTNFACKVWAEFSAWYWPWRISKLWCVLSRKKTFFYKNFYQHLNVFKDCHFLWFYCGEKDQNIQKICVIIPKIDM